MSPQVLAAEMADAETWALAEADRRFLVVHGDDASEWSLLEQAAYSRLIAKVHRVFHADDLAVAS